MRATLSAAGFVAGIGAALWSLAAGAAPFFALLTVVASMGLYALVMMLERIQAAPPEQRRRMRNAHLRFLGLTAAAGLALGGAALLLRIRPGFGGLAALALLVIALLTFGVRRLSKRPS